MQIARWATVALGAGAARHRVGARHSKSVLEAGLTIGSIPLGALLGVFLLGVLTESPRRDRGHRGRGRRARHRPGVHFYTPIAWTWYVLIGTTVTFGVGVLVAIFRARPMPRPVGARQRVPRPAADLTERRARGRPRMEKHCTELKRDLGPWAAASIVVGTVIGSGIFLVPRP